MKPNIHINVPKQVKSVQIKSIFMKKILSTLFIFMFLLKLNLTFTACTARNKSPYLDEVIWDLEKTTELALVTQFWS